MDKFDDKVRSALSEFILFLKLPECLVKQIIFMFSPTA